MDRTHMSRTAPDAVMLGQATLGGYRVAIGQAGYGTLMPDDQAVVHGVLWRLTEQDEAALDRFEAIDEEVYRKDHLLVRTQATEHLAMVYLAVDPAPGVASPDYVRQIVAAAQAAGLPDDYVRSLAQLPQNSSTEPWTPPGQRAGG